MRRLSFYLRLATQNIRKNHRFYLPYILCCVGTAAMFYIMSYLTQDDMIGMMVGAQYVQAIMWLGVIVIAIFSVFILLYTNSFIMKRRRRELGLYNILGMEKRHIAVLMFFETLILSIVSIAGGLLFGILFSKLMILILAQILRFGVPMGFSVNMGAVTLTIIWFAIVFALCLFNNIWGVVKASPIELLHSTAKGEREPRTRWLLALLGAASLFGGYYIAVTTQNPISALGLFFVAVMLVIIGTYCLFTAGSIAVLKGLRRNKKFYYRTGPFTAVSGLIYRMKQNAVGLANICILSTMVLVTISSTVCLYVGIGDIMHIQYPYEIEIDLLSEDKTEQAQLLEMMDNTLSAQGVTADKKEVYYALQFSGSRAGDEYLLDTGNYFDTDSAAGLGFITAADYTALTGEPVTLAKDEMLIYTTFPYTADSITIGGRTFAVKGRLETYPVKDWVTMALTSQEFGIVVADEQVLHDLWQMQSDAYGEHCSNIQYVVGLELDGTADQKLACYTQMRGWLKENAVSGYGIYSRQANIDDTYTLFGSFLFLGIFLGAVFMMAAVLIIYYKQVSEGYEDRERFVIMQKVGMDARTVRRSIRSQVLMVFFLPLITACVHIIFAFPMIARMLKLFSLNNTALFGICTALTLAIFSVIYVIVYSLTARTYYKIVK